ncbi:DUF6162 family protein [Vibrio hyugaensis]|uniref:DUF6162 family protein n=1 Tax=Vibrio hyugaensis TaxID=1534743 RepID=UPI0005F02F03|nr:hypothetical protein [Vibrio hyugaensis]
MITQKIRPDNGNREGKWVALTIAGILAVSTILLPHHQTETEHTDVKSHQVLITDLEQEELAMIAELKLAHEEIRDIHIDANEWPPISELEEFWVAPFVQDQSWQRKGSHQWQQLDAGIYLGIRQDEKGAASMLLDSRNEHADIWFIQSTTMVSDFSLVKVSERQKQGWQQIVLVPASSSNAHAH